MHSSPTSLIVRRAISEDIVQVASFSAELARLHYELDTNRYLLEEPFELYYSNFFSKELANSRALLLVAEAQWGSSSPPTLLGYTYSCLEERDWNALLDACAKIHDLFVHPTARHHGVGHLLMQETMRFLKEMGAPRVLLVTAVQNVQAQSLFTSMGFRPTMVEMTCELESTSANNLPSA